MSRNFPPPTVCTSTHSLWLAETKLVLVSLFFFSAIMLLWLTPAYASTGTTEPVLVNNPISAIDLPGDYPQLRERVNAYIPASQVATTTLDIKITSSPWATLDSNDPDGINVPRIFVVQAVVTNTGTTTATDVIVTLNYEDAANGWVLANGETGIREVRSLAPGATYYPYWFARYPITAGLSHSYTVTAQADNAGLVSTSQNIYENPDGKTVKTRSTNSTGSSGLTQVSSNVLVGVTFNMTVTYNLGTNPSAAIFSPAGNLNFDAGAYRLLSTKVNLFTLNGSDQRTGQIFTSTNQLYFPSLPNVPNTNVEADIIYTLVALEPGNTGLCTYAVTQGGGPPKYDQFYCEGQGVIPLTGTLTIALDKKVSSQTVEQGQILNYTIAYTNTGTQPIRYAWFWDDIPTNLVSLVNGSVTPAGDPDETTANRVAWYFDLIPAVGQSGSTGNLNFSVLVDGNGQDLANGTLLVNQVKLGINPDSFPAGAILTDTVTTTIQAPTITIAKTDGQTTVQPDDTLPYTIQISNSGSATATNLVITDVLPVAAVVSGPVTPNFNSQNGQTLVWNSLGSLAPNGTLTITIPVTLSATLLTDAAIMTNTGTIRYQNNAGHIFATKTATDETEVQIPSTDLAFSKTAQDLNGAPLVVNDTLRYTLRVTNTGNYTAYNVTVTDNLPNVVTCQSVSGPSAPACADPLVWSLAQLGPNSSATLLVDVTIDPEAAGQNIINSGSVTSTNGVDPDPDPQVCPDGSAPVGGQCPTTPIPETSLAFNKTAQDLNGAPLEIGDTIRYTLRVTNTGSYTAYNVTVTDDLPNVVTCQSVSGPSAPGCADSLVWSLAQLGPNSSATLLINVTIEPEAAGQTIINSATVTSVNGSDPDPDPQVCPDGSAPTGGQCPTTPTAPETSLAFSKEAQDLNGAPLETGDVIRYTLRVTNTGNYTAYNVTVTDDLPNQVTCQSVSGPSAPGCADPLVWSLIELGAGEEAVLDIEVIIEPEAAGQTIINSATVTSTNGVDPDPDPQVCPDGSTPTGGQCPTPPTLPNTTLVFSKTAQDLNGAPLKVGDTIRYTLRVTNTGSYTAYNVTVTDDLPNQVTCQSVSGPSAPGCADPLIWNLAQLGPNRSATLLINVKIKADAVGQTIINSGIVTSTNGSNPNPNPQVCPDGSAPIGGQCPTTPTLPLTTLVLSKTAQDLNGTPLVVEDIIRYTLRVTNTGSYTAYNVTVTDDLPNQVTCQSVSGPSAPGCADLLVWSLAQLKAGSSASLLINVKIKRDAVGQTIINSASVTSTNGHNPNPNPRVCPNGSAPVGSVCSITPIIQTFLPLIKQVSPQ